LLLWVVYYLEVLKELKFQRMVLARKLYHALGQPHVANLLLGRLHNLKIL
jgi:hypothetical protein